MGVGWGGGMCCGTGAGLGRVGRCGRFAAALREAPLVDVGPLHWGDGGGRVEGPVPTIGGRGVAGRRACLEHWGTIMGSLPAAALIQKPKETRFVLLNNFFRVD